MGRPGLRSSTLHTTVSRPNVLSDKSTSLPTKSLPSRYLDFTFEIRKGLLLYLLGGLGIDVHGGFNIGVSHNFLNGFDVLLDLAIPGAECVTEIMGGEMADQNRITAISVGLNSFVFDIGSTNAVNGAVDAVRDSGSPYRF